MGTFSKFLWWVLSHNRNFRSAASHWIYDNYISQMSEEDVKKLLRGKSVAETFFPKKEKKHETNR